MKYVLTFDIEPSKLTAVKNSWISVLISFAGESPLLINPAEFRPVESVSAIGTEPVLSDKHPHQPIVTAINDVRRFKANQIVSYLLNLCRDKGIADLDSLAIIPFNDEDRVQFAELTGYSVVGFEELSYVSDAAYEAATKGVL